jgi:hypothetical protein
MSRHKIKHGYNKYILNKSLRTNITEMCLSAYKTFTQIRISHTYQRKYLTGSTRPNPKYTSMRDRGVGERALIWPAAENEFRERCLDGILMLLLAEPKSESAR